MNIKAITLACLLCGSFTIENANAQSSSSGLDNYLVVLGAFSAKENANQFSKQVKKARLEPKVEMNQINRLYYVYVLQTPDHGLARVEADKLRASETFKEAWVFTGTIEQLVTAPVLVPVVEQKPLEEVISVVAIEKKPEPTIPIDSTAIKEKMRHDEIKEKVDNQVAAMKKGEVDRLDYIFFFRDAAVLRPESRYEVDRLARLLKENPKQKIRIHGHTNGNDPGKIIKRANANSDFFSLDNTVEDYGSAKELSEERATLIRDYLVKNGIDKKRMDVKAWGGKKPLFAVDDVKAEANVRVEIEILAHE